MIIPDLLLWIIGLLVFCFVIYKCRRSNDFRGTFALGFFAAIGAVALIIVPAKKIVIVEGKYTHSVINIYGHPNIKLLNGESFPTKGLKLNIGGKYLFNCSNSGMLMYPIVYKNSNELPALFEKADNYKAPDPIYIESGCYDEIICVPDYWFSEEPPKSIKTSENIFEYMWNRIFGSVEVKWHLVPYELPADSEE